MKKFAFLEYIFLFNPGETFSSLQEFETTLGKVFAAQGYDAHVIETVKGAQGRSIVYIAPSDPSLRKMERPAPVTVKMGKKVKL